MESKEICPNCKSKEVYDRFTKEGKSLVYDYVCTECECLFNDEIDYLII